VAKVVSERGRELKADCVVIGAGVAPDAMLARAAGLELGERGGIACSSRLETSMQGIFAAGDAAEFESPLHGRPAVVEHFEVAVEHGRTAALNMLGRAGPHDTVPYFWSDLADWATLEYVGLGVGAGEPVVRGSVEDGEFTAFFLSDGTVTGALAVGRSSDLDHARRMISQRTAPSAAALADEDTDLAEL
jgi:3-phenylpropionate/trans-cinnamate dioxygenase ferredoxin reductase subunit